MIYLYEKCHYFIKNLNLEGDIGYFSSRPIFTLKFSNLQNFNQIFNFLESFLCKTMFYIFVRLDLRNFLSYCSTRLD